MLYCVWATALQNDLIAKTAQHRRWLRARAGALSGLAVVLAVCGSVAALPWRSDENSSTALAALYNSTIASNLVMADNNDAANNSDTDFDLQPNDDAAVTAQANTSANASGPTQHSNPTPVAERRTVALGRGDTLLGLLEDASVSDIEARAAIAALRQVFDPRDLRGGQEVALLFNHNAGQSRFDGLEFQGRGYAQVSVKRLGDAFKADKQEPRLYIERAAASGDIDGSLHSSASASGVPKSVMNQLVKAFSHNVDFARDVKAGDKFEVLFERNTTAEGKAVGDSRLVFAALTLRGQRQALYRYESADGTVDFYNDKGQSIRRAILRTPVQKVRVTSGFGMRNHPILGYSKMHKGVDFGAPYGAPISAAGDGVITRIGTWGAYGRYIQIKHNNQLSTAYAHLSRYASGLKQGSRVRQGQLIGYVGSSGRSTGAHLHYEVHVNGRAVNPLSVKLPAAGRALTGQELKSFKKWLETIDGEYEARLETGPARVTRTANR